MKKVSRRNFLKVSGAMAAAGALAACGGSGAASTSTAASAAAAGEDKFASLGDFTMTVGHAQPEGNPRFVSIHNYGNAHPSGAADLLCRAGHPAGLRHRRFLCDLHPNLCTYLYYHAAAARVERCLQ